MSKIRKTSKVLVAVRVDTEDYVKLIEKSEKENITYSETIRTAIKFYFDITEEKEN